MKNPLQQVFAYIDEANTQDPNIELDHNAKPVAKELLYSRRMSESLNEFLPEASVHLKIAARAQHIQRWKIKRSEYPEGRVGYLTWRKELGVFHAQKTAELMLTAGFGNEDIERTKFLIQKKSIKRDEESQALEDVICLVFLKFYLSDFSLKHNEKKLIDIIQKTWHKMSERGHQAALKLPYSESNFSLIQKALV